MGEETDRVLAQVGGRKRPPTDEITQRRRRALAKVIAYVIVALPGAYSAVRSQYQAETETVAKVNREAADHIVRLQEWSKANREAAERARAEVAALRKELSQDRIEFTKLLVRIARSSRPLRNVRAPGETAPARNPAGGAAEDVQRKVDALAKSAPPPPPRPPAKRLPALKRPAKSLDQLGGL